MKTTIKTIKGWANESSYLFSQNSSNSVFQSNLQKYMTEARINQRGFKQLNTAFDTLRGKDATEKIVIKGRFWRGSWADPTLETVAVFYK